MSQNISFTAYDAVTGAVKYSGTASDPQALATADTLILEGDAYPAEGWLEDLVYYTKPARPSSFHEWDWTTKTWVDPRTLADLKAAKREQINSWRLKANRSHFMFAGEQIACDPLSRSDIDGVTSEVSMTGQLPAGFPNAWKTIANTWVPIPDVAAWASFVSAMVNQGQLNFAHAQDLKVAVDNATTIEEVEAIVW